MQKIFHILILSGLLILGGFLPFSVDSSDLDNETPVPSITRSTPMDDHNSRAVEFSPFDLVIDTFTIYENISYVLRGNLTIKNSGMLSLINSSIIFDSNENITYGVYVENGGTLILSDHDHDPGTTSDRSVIRSNNSGAGSPTLIFHAMPGSILRINNSIIQFGSSEPVVVNNNPLAYTPGLLIESENSLIQNTTIADSGYGVVYSKTNSAKLERVNFINISERAIVLTDSSNVHINDLELTGPDIGIYSRNSEYEMARIVITDMDKGIISLSSTFTLSHCRFENNQDISFYDSTGSIVNNITVINSPFYLNDSSKLTLRELDLSMDMGSVFWDILESMTVDEDSEVIVKKTIEYKFTAPLNQTFPETGKYTILNSFGEPLFTGRINEEQNSIQLDVLVKRRSSSVNTSDNVSGDMNESLLITNNPFRIDYFSNGYYTNESFSLFDSFQFDLQLNFNSQPELRNDRVTPDSGDTKTSFVFFVEYFDMDDDMPLYVNLVLDNKSYTMEPFFDGSTPRSGIQFRVEFFTLAAGNHAFYFEAADGQNLSNSRAVLDGGFPIEVEQLKSDKDDEEDQTGLVTLVITICFIMLFVFVIFVIGLNYSMKKKMKKVGGVEPGTLPEELEGKKLEDKMRCSECGAVIDADARVCPECGEEFEGEEFQCPKCQKLVPEEAEKCPHCGNKFLLLDEDAEIETEEKAEGAGVTTVVDKISCSECGAVVDEAATECPGCGERFDGEIADDEEGSSTGGARKKKGDPGEDGDAEEQLFFCSVCGAGVKESLKACPECGTEFE